MTDAEIDAFFERAEDRSTWPELTDGIWAPYAIALMVLSDHVSFLNGNGRPTPMLRVSDTFHYACADAEPLPLVGFGDARDDDVIRLYNLVRLHGYYGGVVWTAQRRKQLPIPPRVKAMKEAGYWPPEMQALE